MILEKDGMERNTKLTHREICTDNRFIGDNHQITFH